VYNLILYTAQKPLKHEHIDFLGTL